MTVTRKLRLAVWRRDQGVCGLCRRPVTDGEYHIDHILAKSLGGQDVIDNLRVAHGRCNIQRGNGQPRVRNQTRTVGLQVRTPHALEAEIREIARTEDRPVNRTVVRILRMGLAAERRHTTPEATSDA